jgi:hypothetical protein
MRPNVLAELISLGRCAILSRCAKSLKTHEPVLLSDPLVKSWRKIVGGASSANLDRCASERP